MEEIIQEINCKKKNDSPEESSKQKEEEEIKICGIVHEFILSLCERLQQEQRQRLKTEELSSKMIMLLEKNIKNLVFQKLRKAQERKNRIVVGQRKEIQDGKSKSFISSRELNGWEEDTE